ncbi:HNH endonuclease [Mycobacterium sp. 852002-51163_SCH5372311]|uniref:HNH endonuclease n=1 Tax=Mycobacterium sp. 852002-51163_SCH5372311 TaxID=1834097 RepID=UPI0018D2D14F|nr:HNH endonuclease [Mycobacterium sp. 852002-51163_SCH5372311]
MQVPELHLPTDEQCCLHVAATRWRPLKSGLHPTHGRLIVTNRKIRFSALQHGGEVPLSKVLGIVRKAGGDFYLEATTRSLSGQYEVLDPEWAVTVIDTALRIDRRLILQGADTKPSRVIPQHVKAEVWQRDRGHCIQCGANMNLEFDHIIPWSKGGASTVGNVQLLCRPCNLVKSDRL